MSSPKPLGSPFSSQPDEFNEASEPDQLADASDSPDHEIQPISDSGILDIDEETDSKESETKNAQSSTEDHTSDIENFLGQPFERLDQVEIMREFQDDTKTAVDFERELNEKMNMLMLKFRIWAECRPQHECDTQSAKLIADLEDIDERENNQERTRQSLVNFVSTVRTALSALMGN